MLPLVVSTMLRCSTDKMAAGHKTDRSIVAVLIAPVRGRRVESAAVTSAPYTRARKRLKAQLSGGTVGVGAGQFAGVQIADQRRHRARRIDAGAVTDALPHHPLAGRVGVDDGGRGRGDPFRA